MADKFTKLCKIHFSVKSFTAGFSRFFSMYVMYEFLAFWWSASCYPLLNSNIWRILFISYIYTTKIQSLFSCVGTRPPISENAVGLNCKFHGSGTSYKWKWVSLEKIVDKFTKLSKIFSVECFTAEFLWFLSAYAKTCLMSDRLGTCHQIQAFQGFFDFLYP